MTLRFTNTLLIHLIFIILLEKTNNKSLFGVYSVYFYMKHQPSILKKIWKRRNVCTLHLWSICKAWASPAFSLVYRAAHQKPAHVNPHSDRSESQRWEQDSQMFKIFILIYQSKVLLQNASSEKQTKSVFLCGAHVRNLTSNEDNTFISDIV